MKFISIFLLFALALISCSRETSTKTDDVVHINLDPKNINTDGRLSEIVKSIRIIPLETKPECFIESVSRVFFGDRYIVLSTRGSKLDLMLFTSDGKFVRKIGRQGKGPGEYVSIKEFSVLEEDELVFINNGQSGKVMVYSLNGSFVKTIDAVPFSSHAIQLSPDLTAYSFHSDYTIQIVNSASGDTVKQLMKSTKPEYMGHLLKGNSHSGFYYTAFGQDTIWKIDPDTVYPVVTMDFGNGYINFNDWVTESLGNATPGKIVHMGNVIYVDEYYHFSYELSDKSGTKNNYHVLLNEESGEAVHLSSSAESDDILFAGSASCRCSTPKGELVSVIGANDLIDALPLIVANDEFAYSKDLLNDIRSLSIEDNEVMVLMKLK